MAKLVNFIPGREPKKELKEDNKQEDNKQEDNKKNTNSNELEIVRKSKDKESENRFYETNNE